MKRIATHKQPDGDALAALWLAERFLFVDEEIEIVFVSRGATIEADCVVDVGNAHDPARLRFDHKPPAYADRNQHCATELLWQYLREQGKPVAHLSEWVSVVHEGDSTPPRSPSPALRSSRTEGYHRAVADARQTATDDLSLYRAVAAWLDRQFNSATDKTPMSPIEG